MTEILPFLEPFLLRIENIVVQHINSLLDRLKEQVLTAVPTHPTRPVRGIDPHGLYTATFVAKRWDYDSVDTVRENKDLPRAPWRGKGIRYRGADILRYEGVAEEIIFGTPDDVPSAPESIMLPEKDAVTTGPTRPKPSAIAGKARTSASQRPRIPMPSLD